MHFENDIAAGLVARLKQHHPKAFDLVRPVAICGSMVLNGEVVSFHHRQICIEAAKRLQGIGEVLDRLRVDPKAFDPAPPVRPRRSVETQCDREPISEGIVI